MFIIYIQLMEFKGWKLVNETKSSVSCFEFKSQPLHVCCFTVCVCVYKTEEELFLSGSSSLHPETNISVNEEETRRFS